MNSVGFLEALWQDLRYGARGLRLSPGFAAVAILSLVLGIGANTAIFQLFDAVRLKSLPVRQPEHLVDIRVASLGHGGPSNKVGRHPDLTNPVWEQIQARQRVFSGTAEWGTAGFNRAPRGEAHDVEGLYVSGNFFRVLGVSPVLGRVFSTSDDQRGCGAAGAVISYGFWQREFGGEAGVVDRKLMLNGQPFTVVGVTTAGFFGVEVGHRFDVAVPICTEPLLEPGENALDERNYWWLGAIGRLKPGVSIQQASAQLRTISSSIFRATVPEGYYPLEIKRYSSLRLEAAPAGNGVSEIRAAAEPVLMMLLSIAGFVLLIACANLANLMLARGSVREREIAVRLALGASRGRLIRQLLSESLLLAAAGAVLGMMLAQGLSRLLILFISGAGSQISLDMSPDWRVLGFTAAVAVLTCLLFGLMPALRSTRIEPNAAIKAGARGLSTARERLGLRRGLVISQIALSLMLLAGALLFVRSVEKLLTNDAGFRKNGILIANLDLVKFGFSPDRQRGVNRQILQRLRHVPGVESAAIFNIEPAGGSGWNGKVLLEGRENQKPYIYFNRVSDGCFQTLGTPRLAGRDFNENDTPASPKVAIVNEAFARRYTGDISPVGRRFRIDSGPGKPMPFYEIVGLVKDTKYLSLRQGFVPIIYVAESQIADADNQPSFFIRSNVSAGLLPALQKAIGDVEPDATMSFQSFRTDLTTVFCRSG